MSVRYSNKILYAECGSFSTGQLQLKGSASGRGRRRVLHAIAVTAPPGAPMALSGMEFVGGQVYSRWGGLACMPISGGSQSAPSDSASGPRAQADLDGGPHPALSGKCKRSFRDQLRRRYRSCLCLQFLYGEMIISH